MNKVFAYVDGFNVYHNLVAYIKNVNLNHTLTEEHKWLNVERLINFFISSQDEYLEKVTFFSAIPTHLDISKQLRHKNYCDVLSNYCNVDVVNGRFGEKTLKFKCSNCNKYNIEIRHEEKETDVSLAVNVISDVLTNSDINKIVMLTSDTDFIPVVNYLLAKTNKKVKVLLPLGSYKGNAYKSINNQNFQIKYVKEQHIKLAKLDNQINCNGVVYTNPY